MLHNFSLQVVSLMITISGLMHQQNGGIRLLWGMHWAAWQLCNEWRDPSRDIGWLEGIAVELAILATRAMGIHNMDILIWSDNEGVIGAFSKGQCSNFITNLSIHCSDEVYNNVGILAMLTYVNTIDILFPVVFSLQPHRYFLYPFPSLHLLLLSSPMSQPNHLTEFLNGVDVSAQAAAFYANAPSPDIHQLASLLADGWIHIPCTCKDAHIYLHTIVPMFSQVNMCFTRQLLIPTYSKPPYKQHFHPHPPSNCFRSCCFPLTRMCSRCI
jgi:hypothetical protein